MDKKITSEKKAQILKIHSKDNVIVALTDLRKNDIEEWNGNEYLLKENIPAKNKFFENDMKAGEEIFMYGVLVGKTQIDVEKGARVLVENVKHAAQPYSYR